MDDRMAERLVTSGSVSAVEGRGCRDDIARTGMMLLLAVLLIMGLLR